MSIVGDLVGGLTEGAASATPTGAVTAVANLGSKIIDALGLDPEQKAKAQLALEQLRQSGDLQRFTAETGLLQGQINTNKIEAASTNWFVSGWRPGLGWVCDIVLFAYYVPRAILSAALWVIEIAHNGWILTPYPAMDIAEIMGLVATLLGSVGVRAYEKKIGVARN